MWTPRRIALPIAGLAAVAAAASIAGPAARGQAPTPLPPGTVIVPPAPGLTSHDLLEEGKKLLVSHFLVFKKTWKLESNTTQEFRMPVDVQDGSLWDCYGFDARGPGINYAVGDLGYYGPVTPTVGHENEPLGGHPAAVRLPDGSLEFPESRARVTVDRLLNGWLCHAAGWDLTSKEDGLPRPRYRAIFARVHSQTPKAGKARAAFKRSLTPRAAALPFKVTLAGMHVDLNQKVEMIVRVRTGKIPAGTTLSTHARAIITRPRAQP
jgi:hypothetical protein